MSAMFDFIIGKKQGKEAQLEATIEHMGGYLELEIQEGGRLRAALEQIRTVCEDNAPPTCRHKMALDFVRQVADAALR